MVRYLVIFFIFLLFSFKVQGQQIIKPDKLDFEKLKFNSVTKNLIYDNSSENADIIIMYQIINYWFDNKVKIDGFDGSLDVIIKNIDTKKIKKENYFKFSIDMSIEFKLKSLKLGKTQTHNVKSSEFGEIKGSFSINEQEELIIETMYRSISSVSKKILKII